MIYETIGPDLEHAKLATELVVRMPNAIADSPYEQMLIMNVRSNLMQFAFKNLQIKSPYITINRTDAIDCCNAVKFAIWEMNP